MGATAGMMSSMDLSAELSRVVDAMEYEEEMRQIVVRYEASLHEQASHELRAVVAEHEGALTAQATAELGRTRQQVEAALTSQQERCAELEALYSAHAGHSVGQVAA